MLVSITPGVIAVISRHKDLYSAVLEFLVPWILWGNAGIACYALNPRGSLNRPRSKPRGQKNASESSDGTCTNFWVRGIRPEKAGSQARSQKCEKADKRAHPEYFVGISNVKASLHVELMFRVHEIHSESEGSQVGSASMKRCPNMRNEGIWIAESQQNIRLWHKWLWGYMTVCPACVWGSIWPTSLIKEGNKISVRPSVGGHIE